LSRFFERPTIAELVTGIEGTCSQEQKELEKISNILAEVERLSDDDVRSQLARDEAGRGT